MSFCFKHILSFWPLIIPFSRHFVNSCSIFLRTIPQNQFFYQRNKKVKNYSRQILMSWRICEIIVGWLFKIHHQTGRYGERYKKCWRCVKKKKIHTYIYIGLISRPNSILWKRKRSTWGSLRVLSNIPLKIILIQRKYVWLLFFHSFFLILLVFICVPCISWFCVHVHTAKGIK